MRLPINPSLTLVLSCVVSEISQVFYSESDLLLHPNFGGVPVRWTRSSIPKP